MNIHPADTENIRKAAVIIKNGGIVVYPTETVYGIGCNPRNREATERICRVKGREEKALPLICSDMESAQQEAIFNETARRLATHFWPGPLMLILQARGIYPQAVTQGKTTIGLRIPGNTTAISLVQQAGGCIVSTSANKSGQPPATTAVEAAEQLGEEVDFILDGGPSPGVVGSTVLDLTGEHPRILRIGPISEEKIKEVLD